MEPYLVAFASGVAFGYAWDWIFRRGVHTTENIAIGIMSAVIVYGVQLWN